MINAKLHRAFLIDSAFLSCLTGLIAVGHLCRRKTGFYLLLLCLFFPMRH